MPKNDNYVLHLQAQIASSTYMVPIKGASMLKLLFGSLENTRKSRKNVILSLGSVFISPFMREKL